MIGVFGLVDTTAVLIALLAAAATIIAAGIPGHMALSRARRIEGRSAERDDFEALVDRWEKYAGRLEADLTRSLAEVQTLRDEVRKIRDDWRKDRQNYEEIIAGLRAQL